MNTFSSQVFIIYGSEQKQHELHTTDKIFYFDEVSNVTFHFSIFSPILKILRVFLLLFLVWEDFVVPFLGMKAFFCIF